VKEDEDEDEDIEASIRKEISGMAATKDAPKMFQPVFLDVHCVLFFKLQPSIEPVDFVHRICEEAASNPTGRKHRFLNRLTPMTRMGRATQTDLEELAREVLQKHFRLVDGDGTEGKAAESDAQDFCSVSFFIQLSWFEICVLGRLLRDNHGQIWSL
jgi:tRNA acetyltransferase TAN1